MDFSDWMHSLSEKERGNSTFARLHPPNSQTILDADRKEGSDLLSRVTNQGMRRRAGASGVYEGSRESNGIDGLYRKGVVRTVEPVVTRRPSTKLELKKLSASVSGSEDDEPLQRNKASHEEIDERRKRRRQERSVFRQQRGLPLSAQIATENFTSSNGTRNSGASGLNNRTLYISRLIRNRAQLIKKYVRSVSENVSAPKTDNAATNIEAGAAGASRPVVPAPRAVEHARNGRHETAYGRKERNLADDRRNSSDKRRIKFWRAYAEMAPTDNRITVAHISADEQDMLAQSNPLDRVFGGIRLKWQSRNLNLWRNSERMMRVLEMMRRFLIGKKLAMLALPLIFNVLGNSDGGAVWTEWDDWGDCSVSCGPSGFRTRRRLCVASVEKSCSGPSVESSLCENVTACPEGMFSSIAISKRITGLAN